MFSSLTSQSFKMLKQESVKLKEHKFSLTETECRITIFLPSYYPAAVLVCTSEILWDVFSVKSYSEGQKVFSCCVKSS